MRSSLIIICVCSYLRRILPLPRPPALEVLDSASPSHASGLVANGFAAACTICCEKVKYDAPPPPPPPPSRRTAHGSVSSYASSKPPALEIHAVASSSSCTSIAPSSILCWLVMLLVLKIGSYSSLRRRNPMLLGSIRAYALRYVRRCARFASAPPTARVTTGSSWCLSQSATSCSRVGPSCGRCWCRACRGCSCTF